MEKKKSHAKKIFKNKKILVTGGTGSIGRGIVLKLLEYKPAQIRIFSRDDSKQYEFDKELEQLGTDVDVRFFIGDIRDKDRLYKAMGEIDIVFHTAALKHVPHCEYNPFEAVKTNVYGTQNVIDMALEQNVEKVVAISTDKAVNPTNILGVTKLLMEKMVINARYYLGQTRTKFSVVRFGNVLNSRGSVIPLWVDQIKKGGPITITDPNMKRFFMSIPDAVSLVFKAATLMKGGEIFVLKMDEYNILEKAKEIIKEYSDGKKIEIKIVGKRAGEKLVEYLYTEEEKELMVEDEDLYIIYPQNIPTKGVPALSRWAKNKRISMEK